MLKRNSVSTQKRNMNFLSDKKLRDISRQNRYGSSGSVTSVNDNDGNGDGNENGGGSYRDREIVVVATKTTISATRTTNNEGDDGSGGNKRYWSGRLNAIFGFLSIAVADALYIRDVYIERKHKHTLNYIKCKNRGEKRDPYLIT